MRKPSTMMLCLCTVILPSSCVQTHSQTAVPYGANPTAGHYLRVEGVNIYYETYGSGGTPIVLLHGGLYGYIEEFGGLIGELSKDRRVIAIATRGHGKSEIGEKPFSYALSASDAFAVIRHETSKKVDVLGFSDGAITSYTLASGHPELIRRLVAIGGPRKFADWTPSVQAEFKNAKPSDVERDSPQFVSARKKLMPQPDRWLEFVNRVNTMELGPVYVTDAQIQSIKVPALIVAGDHDPYNQTAKVVELFHLLPQGELAIIPGCGHVVLDCKEKFTITAVEAFLNAQQK
ncbi:alpha/beta fold hydrolase [Edaphobacter albus]|uniref:alpha/beta fold hydrolase n=1 Tax=Edaphobacter sp. 4G125 TaxID=2763071 RepID=UPI0016474207|nr:alpha/beta hydrolase [Edaphobacter sp. 4G125]QNI35518.1 alpha/beta hydrolase [Edaphobacter sp. 4G125]